jgi:large-conductance mechanosensitive channel
MHFTLNNSKFTYGHFIDVLLSTIIIVVVIFFAIVYPLQVYKEKNKKDEELVETKSA